MDKGKNKASGVMLRFVKEMMYHIFIKEHMMVDMDPFLK
jgi:hypothetical protein